MLVLCDSEPGAEQRVRGAGKQQCASRLGVVLDLLILNPRETDSRDPTEFPSLCHSPLLQGA